MSATRLPSLAFGALMLLAAPGMAQQASPEQGVPRRNANIWNGQAHEIGAGAIESQERAAGVAPNQNQQRTLNDQVEQLDKEITKDAGQ